MNRRTLRNTILLSLCLALAACGGSTVTGSGSSAVAISISRGTGPAGSGASTVFKAPAAVAGLVFTITADDMETITRTVEVAPAQTVTEAFDVPNGVRRLFVVEAKDATGVVVYQGSETVDLTGDPVTLNITLNPVSSGLTPVTITTTAAEQAGTSAAGAANLVFTITASDMETITRTVAFTAGQAVTETFDVPNGTGRLFSVAAKDAAGRTVAAGSTTGDLDGTAVSLDIALAPAVFTGTRLLGTAQDDFGSAGARDGSGNIYIAGITHGDFNDSLSTGATITGNAFFAKFSQFGEPLLTRQFGTANGTFAFSVAVDGSGNIVVAGGTGGALDGETNNGFTDGFISKFDSSGNRLWTKLIGGAGDDFVNAVAVDSSGNVYATGAIGSAVEPSTGNSDIFVAKFSSSGAQLWKKQYGTPDADSGEAIAVDSAGTVYLAGFTFGSLDADLNPDNVNADASGATSDAFVSKIDTLGLFRITGQFGTVDLDQATSIAVDSAGMVFVAGHTYGNLEGQANANPELSSDMFVIKFDASSTAPSLLFAKLVGTTGNETVNAMSIDASGNVLLAGSTNGAFDGNTNAGGYDSAVVKLSSTGDVVWARQIGTPDRDEANAVLVDSSNNVFVAGSTKGVFDGIQSREFDAFLIMYDANGVKQ